MSEILIKGLTIKDYPQTITINPDGSVIKDTFGLHRLVEEWKAIELPIHGRLVDADSVKNIIRNDVSSDCDECVGYTCGLIDEMPTVIEASN